MIKINRKKLTSSLMTFTTFGIMVLLSFTAVQATTTQRSIDDYAGEYFLFYPGSFSAWVDPESGLAIYPHAVTWVEPQNPGDPYDYNFFNWEYKLLEDCPHYGVIKEREIDSEHVLISINLHVKEVPFLIFTTEGIFYHNEPIYAGEMSYNFECKVIYNKEMLDEWFEVWGRLPSIAEIEFAIPDMYPEELQPVITYSRMTGNGYLTYGGEGRVVVNQVGLFDPDIGDLWWPKDITIVIP